MFHSYNILYALRMYTHCENKNNLRYVRVCVNVYTGIFTICWFASTNFLFDIDASNDYTFFLILYQYIAQLYMSTRFNCVSARA